MKHLITIGILVLLVAAGLYLLLHQPEKTTSHDFQPAETTSTRVETTPSAKPANIPAPATAKTSRQNIPKLLSQAHESLIESTETPESALATLQAIRAALRDPDMDPQTFEDVYQFLLSGKDAETGLPFEVGEFGSLDSSPSMRVELLSLLGEIDLERATQYAKDHVFSQFENPDEWAVSLRNLAWHSEFEHKLTPELETNFHRYLGHHEWLSNPTDGYLLGFDVGVYQNDLAVLQQFALLQNQEFDPAVKSAAQMAMDRMVIATPVATVENILNLSEAFENQANVRAMLVSRLDVRDPGQKALLEQYLTSTDLTAEEADAFANRFPNRSFSISSNLLTVDNQVSIDETASIDIASANYFETSSASPSPVFEIVYPQIKRRLNHLKKQALAH